MVGFCTALALILVDVVLGVGAQEPPRAQAAILQPLAQQARRLESALRYLGEPLSASERQAIDAALALADEGAGVAQIEQVLDRRVLVRVHINPESRVRVEQGAAAPELVQGGTRLFLVKVLNDGGVTAPLVVQSPNMGRVYLPSRNSPEPKMELTEAHVRDRWGEFSIYTQPPMRQRLSGLGIEYVILQVYSRDAGQRSAVLGFSVGQGSQDIGFRNDIEVLFSARPAHPVRVRVRDENGAATTAGFLIRDELDRVYPNISKRIAPDFLLSASGVPR